MLKKCYKILILFILLIFVLVIKLVLPIIDEYGAKGKREPLYVRKYYEFKLDRVIREFRKNEEDIPEELIKKYFINDIYIYPKIIPLGYGEQIEKSWSHPYSFSIFARTFNPNSEIEISNLKIFEKKNIFFNKEVLKIIDSNQLLIDFYIEKNYITHMKYTEDLKVSEVYMKPLIITFDVSTEIDGKIVTKSMKYIMEPVVEKGIQKPIWMYQ